MHHDVVIDCFPWLAAIVASVVVGRLLIARSGSRFCLAHLRHLHRDQRGAVQSLSFVLTLPVFVMLMLFIVQLSQLTIARLMVEYAAYAAARSAIVWIPADLGDNVEPPNCIGIRADRGDTRDERGNEFEVFAVTGPSRKMDKIELAAAMALMPICPSRGVASNVAHPGIAATGSLQKAYQLLVPLSSNNRRVPTRIRNKLAYALENTEVDIEVHHRYDEPSLKIRYDIGPYRDEFAANEIGWQDQILVTVTHDFALLPGPGRLLAKRVIAPGRTSDEVTDRIRQEGSLFVYPLSATVRLSNEGKKPALPYVQNWANRPSDTSP